MSIRRRDRSEVWGMKERVGGIDCLGEFLRGRSDSGGAFIVPFTILSFSTFFAFSVFVSFSII